MRWVARPKPTVAAFEFQYHDEALSGGGPLLAALPAPAGRLASAGMTWTSEQILDNAHAILEAAIADVPDDHHFGNPFMTVHQLAAAVEAAAVEAGDTTGKHAGGEGTGRGSLPEYLGRLISGAIARERAAGRQYRIQGAWLSGRDVSNLQYEGDVTPTTLHSSRGMSMYRAR